MRKIDFISTSPYLSIFEKGSNQTIFGGILFLIYGIVFIILAIIYINDYYSNPNYTFDYTFVKENRNQNQDEWIAKKHLDILESDFEVKLYLKKDKEGSFHSEGQNLSNNFLIIDTDKLYDDTDRSGDYKIIKENSSCVIKQGESHTIVHSSYSSYPLAIFYRCDGTNCSIRKEDKLTTDSYIWIFIIKDITLIIKAKLKKFQLKRNFFLKIFNFWKKQILFL